MRQQVKQANRKNGESKADREDAASREALVCDWRGYIGFARELSRLGALAASGRLPQVLLITGRSGIGKRAFARAVASLFSCTHRNACGQCEGCYRVQHNIDPNLLVLETNGSLKVEDAANLQEHLSLKASRASLHARRIGVITDAEQLTTQACNRLLKTIEEPPEGASLFLTTSRPKALLPTLLSRCVRWPLPPPSVEETLAFIKQRQNEGRLQAPSSQTNESALRALIKRCALSPGLILRELDPIEGGKHKDSADLLSLLRGGSLTGMLTSAEALCREKGWTAQDIAAEAEYSLNQFYRENLNNQDFALHSPLQRKERRDFLVAIKRLAGRGKIVLNAQLMAEQLGLFSI